MVITRGVQGKRIADDPRSLARSRARRGDSAGYGRR
jgi:hypothetical protein